MAYIQLCCYDSAGDCNRDVIVPLWCCYDCAFRDRDRDRAIVVVVVIIIVLVAVVFVVLSVSYCKDVSWIVTIVIITAIIIIIIIIIVIIIIIIVEFNYYGIMPSSTYTNNNFNLTAMPSSTYTNNNFNLPAMSVYIIFNTISYGTYIFNERNRSWFSFFFCSWQIVNYEISVVSVEFTFLIRVGFVGFVFLYWLVLTSTQTIQINTLFMHTSYNIIYYYILYAMLLQPPRSIALPNTIYCNYQLPKVY